MKSLNSILSRVLLGGSLILALTPCASCGMDKMAVGKGMQCSNASCCQSRKGCHHQAPKDCRHLTKARIQGVVFAKSVRPDVGLQAVPVPPFAVSAISQNLQVFKHFNPIQSPPRSSLILRI